MIFNQKCSSLRECIRKCFHQLSIRAFGLGVFFLLAACTLLSGCEEKAGEEFASWQDVMEAESPYLSQEDLEEQLKLRLNEYIYYEGGILYDKSLLSYKGTTLDYVVLHQKSWDKEETEYTQYVVSILLQPQEEGLTTTMVNLTVYNESLYELSLAGNFGRKVDLGDVAGDQELAASLGLTDESAAKSLFGDVKFWYQGTVTVGNGEKPEYPDFQEKEERVAEIYEWAEDYLEKAEWKEDARILIRDFRKEDSSTEVLVESKEADMAPLLLPYYFYQENDFQHPLELNEDRYDAYIEKFMHCTVDK